jgi:uncharacterized protein
MPVIFAAFGCGLLFGFGLMISGMTQPAKVLNFLDPFGTWDPSLALVMAAALIVSGLGFMLARRRKPVLAAQSLWPTKRDIDIPLLGGAALFGAGWGLVGLCPGPALVDLAAFSQPVIVFVAAMIAGMAAHDYWQRQSLKRTMASAADG